MSLPPQLAGAVLAKSNANALLKDETKDGKGKEEMPEKVQGYDFNKGIDYDALLKSYLSTGLQAYNFGEAVREVREMVCKLYIIYYCSRSIDVNNNSFFSLLSVELEGC
jgi:hypothetical protein